MVQPSKQATTMENEKISQAQVHKTTVIDEKHQAEITEHEPYDAVVLNMNLGEFPMHPTPRGGHDQLSLKEQLLQEEVPDLYQPFDIDETIPYESHILTIRAVLVGIVLGCLVNASNLYLGKFKPLHNDWDNFNTLKA
jgi:hypothetical protein